MDGFTADGMLVIDNVFKHGGAQGGLIGMQQTTITMRWEEGSLRSQFVYQYFEPQLTHFLRLKTHKRVSRSRIKFPGIRYYFRVSGSRE